MAGSGRATGPTAAGQPDPPSARDEPEQLGFDGMPERLFVCTPSKLGAYADCPRRYRYTYVDRPAPPKGPPWAHNSLGASVHTALRNWYALPAERRRPEALASLLKGDLGPRGLPRRRAGAGRVTAGRWAGWSPTWTTLDPDDEPVGVERVVAAKTAVLALHGRADRIDARPGPDGPSW